MQFETMMIRVPSLPASTIIEAMDNCYYGAASISCPERAAGTIGVNGAERRS
jgi:hypothetical protein